MKHFEKSDFEKIVRQFELFDRFARIEETKDETIFLMNSYQHDLKRGKIFLSTDIFKRFAEYYDMKLEAIRYDYVHSNVLLRTCGIGLEGKIYENDKENLK